MRAELAEWYPLAPDEEQRALASASIVFDTSSLLTLYRLAHPDRVLVMDLMEAVKDRLWIPHRVAYEFQKNRLRAFYEQLKAYDEVQEKLEKLSKQLFDSLPAHPVLTQGDIRREIEDRLAGIGRYIAEQQRARHPQDLLDVRGPDGVRDGLDQLFAGKVGAFVANTMNTLEDAKRRFAEKIPPGYEDEKKPIPDRYGDCFLWLETLSHVAKRPDGERGLLLVLEDMKEDWWLMSPVDGSRLGPRPELIREAAAKGVRPLMMMSLRKFHERMATHLGWERRPLGEYAPVQDPVAVVDPADASGQHETGDKSRRAGRADDDEAPRNRE